MRPAAVLAVFTFTAGRRGLLRFRRVRERITRVRGLRVFELPQMERHLADAGFQDFKPAVSGSILTFSARKRSN
jgi:hypothetical protein